LKKTAISDWHKQLYTEEKTANPDKYPDYLQRKSPGPGQYGMKETMVNNKTY